jgi:hypothetical protein
MTAGAFEPDAELGHRPHRRERCLGDFDEGDGLVGAGHLEVAALEFDVARVRLQHRGRHQLGLVDDRVRGSAQCTAANDRAARAVGAAPELHFGRVALHIADLLEGHPEEFMDEL